MICSTNLKQLPPGMSAMSFLHTACYHLTTLLDRFGGEFEELEQLEFGLAGVEVDHKRLGSKSNTMIKCLF